MKTKEMSSIHCSVDAYHRDCAAFYEKGDMVAAEKICREGLTAFPDEGGLLNNLAVVLRRCHRLAEASDVFSIMTEKGISTAETLSNWGNTLKAMGKMKEAHDVFKRSLELKPDRADTHFNLASLYFDLRRWLDAMKSFDRSLELNRDQPYALGLALLSRALMAHWDGVNEIACQLEAAILENRRAATPFVFLGFLDGPEIQCRAAEIYVRDKYSSCVIDLPVPLKAKKLPVHGEKIRLAYISPDFHNHPVSHLMIDTFLLHARNRFEVIAVSIHSGRVDEWQEKIFSAADRVIDGTGMSDYDLACQLRSIGIDIAIDLAGHTRNSRPLIFYHRVAPIQVGYIGFPGTSGMGCMDYFIADEFTVPYDMDRYFSEKIIRLPNCFQPVSRRTATNAMVSRETEGLPADVFVFCCFNNTYKIQPVIFNAWLKILENTPKSILWLYAENGEAAENMKAYAEKMGIDPRRLLFAGRVDTGRYLARYRLADIFLDTPIYNGGTTVADALWMGLPVLTLPGRSMVARMAGSLVAAAGIAEMRVDSVENYIERACYLAKNPSELRTIREKIRIENPLFDSGRFVSCLEESYEQMLEKPHQAILVKRRLLHVGCGNQRQKDLPYPFNGPEWEEIRFDINPKVKPHIIGDMKDMSMIRSETMSAVYSSHNLEHLYAHEVSQALSEFYRVLRSNGIVFILVPDIKAVAEFMSVKDADATMYESPAGPITPLDVLYGYGAAIKNGNFFMAHKTGFTAKTIEQLLRKAGFSSVKTGSDRHYNLWAFATKA